MRGYIGAHNVLGNTKTVISPSRKSLSKSAGIRTVLNLWYPGNLYLSSARDAALTLAQVKMNFHSEQ